MPSRQLNVNRLGLELVGLAADLLAWTAILPGGELASAEPNKLRYRLHAAARLVRGQRRLHVRIDRR